MKEELLGNTITYNSIHIGEDHKVHAQVTIETEKAQGVHTFTADSLAHLMGCVVVAMVKQKEQEREIA